MGLWQPRDRARPGYAACGRTRSGGRLRFGLFNVGKREAFGLAVVAFAAYCFAVIAAYVFAAAGARSSR